MNIDSIVRELIGQASGITADSRSVKPGFIFVCLSEAAKGFVPDAVKAGAKFIVAGNAGGLPHVDHSQIIICPMQHDLYYKLASEFYHGSQPEFVAVVTGTNGKTSVADFCRQIWCLTGHTGASMGTLGAIVGNTTLPSSTSFTTPDAVELHKTLSTLRDLQVKYLCMEASSHGMAQKRLYGVKASAAAFTNLSGDHLDYHGSMEKYWATKQKLFSEVLSCEGCAVLNADSEQYGELRELAAGRNIITYGVDTGDVKLARLERNTQGHNITVKVCGEVIYDGAFPVLGKFQISNLLCALAIVAASGSGHRDVPIDRLASPRGRMELIGDRIIIDYAHTSDALKHALTSLKWHGFPQKTVLVFGCGGDRDREKRKTMGMVASQYADVVIVTDDNPRSENPETIRKEIMLHCENAIEIPDRGDAIHYAVNFAIRNNYVLLIAGKGHETTQQIAGKSVEFNDGTAVRRCLSEMQYA
ncbi:UDP-N-acetylmuramoyl-L-alanyl-D-glutamate--2,6-diaminopimelate ligase [Anaplasma marginale]|uniref:UDP-N-acetylmuramoyl-L-alanyl-D-glutamate--2, 6-diaminopimelate ligase n=1 Tax=Anaplasma marginale TaxID=770 RepID=UPI00031647E9|nr:UDP-N-acetylmuramoyl-L-alanyl-D-glutamate--2,6-diaminopimelate ligase [Anaplasma marginale]